MNLLAHLNNHVGKLVHPALQGKRLEFLAHRDFLATRLATTLCALITAPLYLALGNAPAWWQAASLAWLLLPIAAVAYVSRTGDLARGEAISLAAWIGLATTLALASGSATGLGLLLIVPFEAVLTLAPLPMAAIGAVSIAAALAIALPLLAALAPGRAPDPMLLRFGTYLIGGAEIYGVVLALLAGRLHMRRRRHEQRGHDNYRALTDLIDQLPLRLDRTGLVLHAGAGTQRLFGIAARDLLGRGLFERVHVADRPTYLKLVADTADGRSDCVGLVRLRTGTTLPSDKGAFREPVFAWTELRTRVEGGADMPHAKCTILCLMQDVTGREIAREELETAKAEALRGEAERGLFLANVSHELRTPLNAIIGFADLLASEELGPREPAKQREYAAIIRQSGHHLLAVVNSILDASKIEAGSFSILPEPFDLALLVESSCDMVALKAASSGIEIVRDIASGLTQVVGDERAYKQVVLNLLSNAIKFTPGGGRVSVSAYPEGTSIILAVADNGVGINPSDLPKLGAPFFQAQNSYDRAYDGTGLGLSVVRGLVGLHGGSMRIESAVGQGTRVAIRLPADCRAYLKCSANDTKIETIPRYVPSSQYGPGPADFARIHKIA